MADRAAADEVLADLVDLDRAHRARETAGFFDRVLHRERVHDGREHAHVVAGHAVHARGLQARAPEDVAAADDDADLDAFVLHFDDLAREALQHFGIDAVVGAAHQRFARELQEDALELDVSGHACVPGGQNGRIVLAKEKAATCAAFSRERNPSPRHSGEGRNPFWLSAAGGRIKMGPGLRRDDGVRA